MTEVKFEIQSANFGPGDDAWIVRAVCEIEERHLTNKKGIENNLDEIKSALIAIISERAKNFELETIT